MVGRSSRPSEIASEGSIGTCGTSLHVIAKRVEADELSRTRCYWQTSYPFSTTLGPQLHYLRLSSGTESCSCMNILHSLKALLGGLFSLLRVGGVICVSLVAAGDLSVCRHDDGLGSCLVLDESEVLVR